MIIFDLDGTLADCEHRRHFIDPEKNPDYEFMQYQNIGNLLIKDEWWHRNEMVRGIPPSRKRWKPNWKAFFDACDQDKPIDPSIITLRRHSQHEDIQIWSGRCESVREKTIAWFHHNVTGFAPTYWFQKNLLMRPIGDSTPDDKLKEMWLERHIAAGREPIEMVFDDRPKVVRMWRRRGVFVFDCNQLGKEF